MYPSSGEVPLPGQADVHFEYFDRLYDQDREQYREMIQLYLAEYGEYRRGITHTIKAGDVPEFRRIKHKLVYSLHLIGMDHLRQALEVMSHRLPTLTDQDRAHQAHQVDSLFAEISDKLSAKLTELPS